MLRCASSFVIAAYEAVRLIPQESRALPLELFTKPLPEDHFVNVFKMIVIPSLCGTVMVKG